MDYNFCGFNPLKRRAGGIALVVIAAGLVLWGLTNTSQGGVWSFEDNPHPINFDELSAKEQQDLQSAQGSCERNLAIEYKIYLGRYPGYEKSGDAKTNFKNWKNYLAGLISKPVNACLFHIPYLKIWNLYQSPQVGDDFYYCGFYSRSPGTVAEQKIATLVDEAISYASTGSWIAISSLMAANRPGGIFDLNPDIEYYFRKLTRPAAGSEIQERDTSQLELFLDAERTTFLDAAVGRKDLQAVMDTSGPCKRRQQK